MLFLWLNMSLCQWREFHIRWETKILCLRTGQVYRGRVQCFQASTYSATHLLKLWFERTTNCWGERSKFIISYPFHHRSSHNQRLLLDLGRGLPLIEFLIKKRFENSIKIGAVVMYPAYERLHVICVIISGKLLSRNIWNIFFFWVWTSYRILIINVSLLFLEISS